jgi:hypothetical protein
MLEPRGDGRFVLHLSDDLRQAVAELMMQLVDRIDEPDDPALKRLRPIAYTEDPDRDAEYQLLAGDELRSSQREAIGTMLTSMDAVSMSVEDLWGWMRALNALRLLTGTMLDITDDEYEPPRWSDLEPSEAGLWSVYDLAGQLQHEVIQALEA